MIECVSCVISWSGFSLNSFRSISRNKRLDVGLESWTLEFDDGKKCQRFTLCYLISYLRISQTAFFKYCASLWKLTILENIDFLIFLLILTLLDGYLVNLKWLRADNLCNWLRYYFIALPITQSVHATTKELTL